MTKPIYGHSSPETAYVVGDYPYGRTLRCRIRYWLERHPKRGFRFVSQTENPKTLRWNAPKPSTYALLGGCMYLIDEGHVRWDGVGEYSDGQKVLDFVRRYPKADFSLLCPFAARKVAFLRKYAKGEADLARWIEVFGATRGIQTPKEDT